MEKANQTRPAWLRIVVVCLVLLTAISGGFYFMRHMAPVGLAEPGLTEPGLTELAVADPKDEPGAKPAPQHFLNWVKPDLIMVISGEMHGYMQPCGCSSPQYGGLSRRYNFIQSLREKNWPVVALDVGELAQGLGPQSLLKYVYSMKALHLMGYSAVGLGKTEFNMPLLTTLGEYSLNHPQPTPISSNLAQAPKGPDFYEMNVRKFKIVDIVSPRLGIVSVTDPRVQLQITDPDSKFLPAIQALPPVLKEVRKSKAELIALLYQGNDTVEVVKFAKDLKEARDKDATVPSVSFILCLSSDPEPPGRPRAVEGVQVITVGHKGRYVGVVGLFKKGNAYEMKYELVAMGPEYETPAGKEKSNPVMALMDDYAQTVKTQNYLAKFPRGLHPIAAQLKNHKIETKYVGSAICANCHEHADAVWDQPRKNGHKGHSTAFDVLVSAKRPSLRQHDGECVVCHAVGFQYDTGYYDKNNTAKQNANLVHVGCESCHGPSGAHTNDSGNALIKKIINPYSTKRVPQEIVGKPALIATFVNRQLLAMDGFCQKCHDMENDVHWGKAPFAQKYHKIEHNFPPRNPFALIQAGNPAPGANVGGVPVNNPGAAVDSDKKK